MSEPSAHDYANVAQSMALEAVRCVYGEDVSRREQGERVTQFTFSLADKTALAAVKLAEQFPLPSEKLNRYACGVYAYYMGMFHVLGGDIACEVVKRVGGGEK